MQLTGQEGRSIAGSAPGAVAAAKVFFAKAIGSQGLAPETITPDGFAASHRAAREMKVEGLLPEETTLKSSRYLKNRIDRIHRNVKSRVDVMLGFKRFRDYSTVTISGIELMTSHSLRPTRSDRRAAHTHTTAPVVWIARRSVCGVDAQTGGFSLAFAIGTTPDWNNAVSVWVTRMARWLTTSPA